jgi:hypothetical protein
VAASLERFLSASVEYVSESEYLNALLVQTSFFLPLNLGDDGFDL